MAALPTRLWARLRTSVRAASLRLRPNLWPAVQASVAVAVAWYLAHEVLGHAAPIFAPVAAAVALGAGRLLRGQRAVQLIGGVTLGIGIGTAVGALAGSGALALGLATLLALGVAIGIGGGFTGSGVMFINQTSVSAILVIALQQSGGARWAHRRAVHRSGDRASRAAAVAPALRGPRRRRPLGAPQPARERGAEPAA